MNDLDRFDALAAKVERGFDAIRRRNGGCMECQKGCSDCCRCRLSITRLEEAVLRRGLARLPESVRGELAERASAKVQEMCPALDANGACQVYDSRPLICRSHGVPLRYRHPVPLIHPSRIDVCEKNFTEVSGDSLPVRDVMDQTSLTAELAAIDAEFCDAHGLAHGVRVSLAQILAGDV